MDELAKQLAVCLIAGHIFGDFLFQSQKVAFRKHKIIVLFQHTAIIVVTSYVLCGAWSRWEIPVILLVSHALFDFIKATWAQRSLRGFMVDQTAHLTVIGIIVFGAIKPGDAVSLFWVNFWGEDYLRLLILLAGAVATIKAGRLIIGMAVEPFLEQIRAYEQQSHPRSAGDALPVSSGFETGGRVIGQLERALIFLFVLANQPAGIGFLIAAKSVFRFGEIKNQRHRMEAEYILIGTLMSFGYGILIAYATKFFMGVI
ncbi:MAG: DUF3307 domain-containing protein [Desulfobacterales bacterium]|nr:MAG: DUF3307 domain-containing protein [Desulfobacterales bacterium]